MNDAYEVAFSAHAKRQLRKLDPQTRLKLIAALEALATNPHGINLNVKPMKGDDKGAWRLRVGNYRIIYDLYDGELVVWVIELGHRRDIYQGG